MDYVREDARGDTREGVDVAWPLRVRFCGISTVMLSSGSANDCGEGKPWSLRGSRSVGGSDSVESSGGVAIASATTSSILHGKTNRGASTHFYVSGLGDEGQRKL
jgi:hypothetical protein